MHQNGSTQQPTQRPGQQKNKNMKKTQNTTTLLEAQDATVKSFALLQPKEEGGLPKVSISFELKDKKVIWWNRYVYADATKNASLKDGLQKLGVDINNPEKVVGQTANVTPEKGDGFMKVGFINNYFAHSVMPKAVQKKVLKDLLG